MMLREPFPVVSDSDERIAECRPHTRIINIYISNSDLYPYISKHMHFMLAYEVET